MNRSVATLLVVLLPFAACIGDGPTATESGPRLTRGGGGSTTYGYGMTGDIASTGSAPAAQMKTGSPFANLAISELDVVLGAPTGDVSACRTGSGVYTDTFGENGGQVWTGTLKIAKTQTLSFLGTNESGESLQFSVSDATGGPVQSSEGGTYSYAYTDARLFFGGNSTHHDGMYRCVNLTVTATP